MIRSPKLVIAATCLALAGCSEIPDFSSGAAADAPYPKIISTDAILGQVPEEQGDYGISDLEARAAALRARAADMQASGVGEDPAPETDDTADQT